MIWELIMVKDLQQAKGSEHGMAKLNEEKVKEIKKLLASGESSRWIGSKFGVDKSTILRIKNGTNWKHVE